MCREALIVFYAIEDLVLIIDLLDKPCCARV